jgi:hypothetical protein
LIAGMVVANLLYVVGAIVAATVVSGFVLLRHRRPKSLEAGIEMFSRELKALEPERPGSTLHGSTTVYGSGGGTQPRPRRMNGGNGANPGGRSSGLPLRSPVARPTGRTVTPLVTTPPRQPPDGAATESPRDAARSPSPDGENESG